VKAPIVYYRYWKYCTSAVGLRESVGKTYVSREFIELNSRRFNYSSDPLEDPFLEWDPREEELVDRPRHFQQVQFVNSGLLNGVKRSGESLGLKDLDEYSSLGHRATDLVRSSPEWLRDKVLWNFREKNHELLSTLHPIPMFIPTSLGGLGFPILEGTSHVPSKTDLRLAQRIYSSTDPSWKPEMLGGKKLGWVIRKLAAKRLPAPTKRVFHSKETGSEIDVGETSFTRDYESLLGRATVALLFDSTLTLADFHPRYDKLGKTKSDAELARMEKNSFKQLHRAINHNRKIWSPKMDFDHWKGKLPQPIDLSCLDEVPKEGLTVFYGESMTSKIKSVKGGTSVITETTLKKPSSFDLINGKMVFRNSLDSYSELASIRVVKRELTENEKRLKGEQEESLQKLARKKFPHQPKRSPSSKHKASSAARESQKKPQKFRKFKKQQKTVGVGTKKKRNGK